MEKLLITVRIFKVDDHSQLMDGSHGPHMEELEKLPKVLKGTAIL